MDRYILMKKLLLSLALAFLPLGADAGDLVRKGRAEDCYLYAWGKGFPDGLAKLEVEFMLEHLKEKQPYVSDHGKASAESLVWVEKISEPVMTGVIRYHGKRIVRIDYPLQNGKFGATISLVMLVMETGVGSEWFKPFFVAQPELFTGYPMVSKEGKAGYLAVLEYSGTGGYATHHLFDFAQPFPKLVTRISTGRVSRNEIRDEAKYQKALANSLNGEKLRNGEWVEGIEVAEQ